jgi:hypothetical protein
MPSDTSLLITAWKRPRYLRRTLASWAQAPGAKDLRSVTIALGRSDREHEQREIIAVAEGWFGREITVHPDSDAATASPGMHRAIAEGVSAAFAGDPGLEFLICSEEDVLVSDDALAYFAWANAEFCDDPSVLGVLAHSPGGQGWDPHVPADDADADQQAVRLLPYFNAWGWGVWRNRWEQVMEPEWDWECNSGGPMDSGYDWHLATRIIPRWNMTCATPDASRSQNIGRFEGWASNPASFSFSQAQSFREHRDPAPYRLVVNDAQEAHTQ